MRPIFLHIILFIVTLAPTAAGSQYLPPDTLNLKMIEIKATRADETQASQRKLDSLSLQAFSQSSLGELLTAGSPVFLKQNGPGGLTTASFRGTAASHTLVLWNEIPINAPHLGQVDFSSIPVFFIDEVGLLWGSSASASRAGGIGGVVSINNQNGFKNGLHGQLTQSAGSFGNQGTYLSLGYGNRKLQLRTRVFRKSGRNDFNYLNTGTIPTTRMKQQNASFLDYGLLQEINLMGKQSMLKVISWNQWNEHELPPLMTNLERGGDPREFRNDQFSRNIVSYDHYFTGGGKLALKTALFVEKQHYYLQTTTADQNEIVSLIDSHNHSESWFNTLHYVHQLDAALQLFTKIHFDHEQASSSHYDGLKSRHRLAATAGTEINPLKRLHTQLSIRADMADGRYTGLSPALEATYTFLPNKSLEAGLGLYQNLRYPGLNDLYWFPGGNPDLLPEKSLGTDFSLQHHVENKSLKITSKASLYLAKIDNWIQWRPTGYRYWVPANIAHVYTRGIEWYTTLHYTFDKLSWQLLINYAYTRTTDESPTARIENSAGKQLIYIPRHHGNARLNMHWQGYSVSWTSIYTGERNTSLNTDATVSGILPAYNLHNLSGGKIFSGQNVRLSIELRINNIFNTDYQAVLWRAMPGRNYEAVVKISLL